MVRTSPLGQDCSFPATGGNVRVARRRSFARYRKGGWDSPKADVLNAHWTLPVQSCQLPNMILVICSTHLSASVCNFDFSNAALSA